MEAWFRRRPMAADIPKPEAFSTNPGSETRAVVLHNPLQTKQGFSLCATRGPPARDFRAGHDRARSRVEHSREFYGMVFAVVALIPSVLAHTPVVKSPHMAAAVSGFHKTQV